MDVLEQHLILFTVEHQDTRNVCLSSQQMHISSALVKERIDLSAFINRVQLNQNKAGESQPEAGYLNMTVNVPAAS